MCATFQIILFAIPCAFCVHPYDTVFLFNCPRQQVTALLAKGHIRPTSSPSHQCSLARKPQTACPSFSQVVDTANAVQQNTQEMEAECSALQAENTHLQSVVTRLEVQVNELQADVETRSSALESLEGTLTKIERSVDSGRDRSPLAGDIFFLLLACSILSTVCPALPTVALPSQLVALSSQLFALPSQQFALPSRLFALPFHMCYRVWPQWPALRQEIRPYGCCLETAL